MIFLNSVLIQNGISRTAIREENDYYATDPKAIDLLLQHEVFDRNIWECACGEGNLSEALKDYGYNVFSTDLIDRGYPDDIVDFLKTDIKFSGDIITNPPFKHSTEFITKALDVIPFGNKVAMFMKLTYLSGKKRYEEIYSKYPPAKVYVFTRRVSCSKNNTVEGFKSGALDFAWFIWEKGKIGCTELKWIKM